MSTQRYVDLPEERPVRPHLRGVDSDYNVADIAARTGRPVKAVAALAGELARDGLECTEPDFERLARIWLT
jgi:hypothetical protein